MTCTDCLQNCREIVSDQCVEYTGPTLNAPFNVCQGNQLSIYEANVVSVIQSLLDGSSAIPANILITQCTFFQQQFGSAAKTVSNLLQALINGECNLNAQIAAVVAQINSTQNGSVIDTACLTGLSAQPTTSQIIQAIITLLCTINTTVNAFPSTYVKLSDLTSLVTTIVNNINNSGGVSQQSTKLVPYTAVAYFGPLSNFDSSGIGIVSLGFNRIFICNGSNGTPDMRGRTVVGAIRNIPGPSLDPAVDPAVNPNNPNWAINDKAGETFHTLTIAELASHNHGVTDPQHQHSITGSTQTNFGGSGSVPGVAFTGAESGGSTNIASTGISIQSSGGGQPHNNIQPSISGVYIMYIP